MGKSSLDNHTKHLLLFSTEESKSYTLRKKEQWSGTLSTTGIICTFKVVICRVQV